MNKFMKPPEGFQYMVRVERYRPESDYKNYYSLADSVISINDSEIISKESKCQTFFEEKKFWAKVKVNDIELTDKSLISVSVKVSNGEYANVEVDRDLVSSIDLETLFEKNQEFVSQNNL